MSAMLQLFHAGTQICPTLQLKCDRLNLLQKECLSDRMDSPEARAQRGCVCERDYHLLCQSRLPEPAEQWTGLHLQTRTKLLAVTRVRLSTCSLLTEGSAAGSWREASSASL